MLRDAGLGDAELGRHDRAELTRRSLPVGQELENAPAHGIAEHLEGGHGRSLALPAYISQASIIEDQTNRYVNGAKGMFRITMKMPQAAMKKLIVLALIFGAGIFFPVTCWIDQAT